MPTLSLMLMGRRKVVSFVGTFLRLSLADVPVAYKNKWLCNTCSFHSAAAPQYSGVHTVNRHQLPVRVFLVILQAEGEGLGIGGAVCITGLDENGFKFLHTHESLIFHQFGNVVVHIQYSHGKNMLRGLLRVGFRQKSEIIIQKRITLVPLSCLYSMKRLFMSKVKALNPVTLCKKKNKMYWLMNKF